MCELFVTLHLDMCKVYLCEMCAIRPERACSSRKHRVPYLLICGLLSIQFIMRQLKISKSITNRESASLDKYLQEIGREELISVEQEVELAQRIREGDQAALDKLTRANLRFVVSVAKQYQNQGLSLPTLSTKVTSD